MIFIQGAHSPWRFSVGPWKLKIKQNYLKNAFTTVISLVISLVIYLFPTTGMIDCKTNMNCSQLCLLTPNGGICACSNGYELLPDNTTCNGTYS